MPAPIFGVRPAPDPDVVVVAPEGALDLHTVGDLAGIIDELRTFGFDRVRLDLSGLTAIDSHGVRYVVRVIAEQGGRLDVVLVPGPPAVQRIFELVGAPTG